MTDTCFYKAEAGEPTFTLLGRDRHAAVLVNMWSVLRQLDGETDQAKIDSANTIANEMAAWVMAKGEAPVGLAGISQAVAAFAEMVGGVVTIEQEPLEPLAMGHYRHVVSVRPKRQERAAAALETMIEALQQPAPTEAPTLTLVAAAAQGVDRV